MDHRNATVELVPCYLGRIPAFAKDVIVNGSNVGHVWYHLDRARWRASGDSIWHKTREDAIRSVVVRECHRQKLLAMLRG